MKKRKVYKVVKYRKSIVDGMQEDYVKKWGFEESYRRFERSINRMQKEGDHAEEIAYQYLKKKNLLGENYSKNRVIALGRIKIEADIIDYDNKIIYETKSRRNPETSRRDIKKKWKLFEFDKKNSIYQNFQFYGIVVVNTDDGPVVKGIAKFHNSKVNSEKMQLIIDKHFQKIENFKSVEVVPNHRIKKKTRKN